MAFRVVTAPTVEPVSLAEAKLWCRETGTDQDSLISMLIASHRRFAEEILTGRAFVQREIQAFFEEFIEDEAEPEDQTTVVLPFPPLVSVSAVEYIDTAGNLQTAPPANYQVDIYSEPGRIKPTYGNYWPAIRCSDFNPVRVTYIAGYPAIGSPADYAAAVPENLKEWLLRRVSTAYENREGLISGVSGYFEVKRDFVDGLIDDLVLGSRAI